MLQMDGRFVTIRPHFGDCLTREPSLYTIVRDYYASHGLPNPDELAKDYLVEWLKLFDIVK